MLHLMTWKMALHVLLLFYTLSLHAAAFSVWTIAKPRQNTAEKHQRCPVVPNNQPISNYARKNQQRHPSQYTNGKIIFTKEMPCSKFL